MQVCENVERTALWQPGSSPRTVLSRAPAAVKRDRRTFVMPVPVVWTVVRVAAALVPWSALAWLFIAD
jgi:hypothetical protein